MPGDVIEIVDKIVYINGFPLQEDLYTKVDLKNVIPKGNGEASRRDNLAPTKIPDFHYFMMGDNRDNSHDSRFWGFLDEEYIKGQAFILYWSWDSQRRFPRFKRIGELIK